MSREEYDKKHPFANDYANAVVEALRSIKE